MLVHAAIGATLGAGIQIGHGISSLRSFKRCAPAQTQRPECAQQLINCPRREKGVESRSTMSAAGQKLLFNGTNNVCVGEGYVLPEAERVRLEEVDFSDSIPVIDLRDLDGPNRPFVIRHIKEACESNGFFQIVNHGVPEQVMEDMIRKAKEFFKLPLEDKIHLYSEDPKDLTRLSTSFNRTKDQVYNWRDYLRHECNPLEDYIDQWPEKPAGYREVAGRYATEVKNLVGRLLAAISEAMGEASGYLSKVFGQHVQTLAINYYPPCPNPELTVGIMGHSDPDGITVLMQGDVSGLQVRRNGKWVAVEPIRNAFVVNLADQLEVISNGRFRSIEHRAVTNARCARISIPTFYGPSMDAYISPAPSMVDEDHPAIFRGYRFEEFKKVFWSQGLNGKSVLDHFRIKAE